MPLLWLLGSIALVIVLARCRDLRRVIWLARVPVALAVIALVALAVPEQTQFLVAGVQTGRQALGFLFAVLLTGIGTWFWTRWSLNLAWQAREPDAAALHGGFWSRWVPRIVALSPVAAAAWCLWNAWDLFRDGMRWMPWVLAIGLGLVAALLVGLAWGRRFVIERRRRQGRARPDITGHSVFADESLPNPPGPRPEGLAAWLRLALACLPFRWPVLVPLLFFLVAVVSVQGGWTWPSLVASWFGAAPTALLGLAVLLTLLAPTVGLVALACRWPALVFLGILVIGAAAATVNTLVRTEAPLPPRPTLDAAAERWLQACAAPERGVIRAMIVANAGGASRAALWTAASMRALERHPAGPRLRPGRELFAISGISGGALGAAAYVATLDAAGAQCGADAPDPDGRLQRLQAGLKEDFLAPALTGLFFGDGIWRTLGPLSAAAGWLGWWPEDRTVRMERSWEAAFDNGRGSAMAGMLVARSFAGSADATPRLPLLFTAGTHQERGRLAVTSPVRLDGHVREAIDVLQTLESDVPFSVAASNSARFPYVTSPGLLRARESGTPYGQIVDGGYYDNVGAVAARAAADALVEAHRRLAAPGGALAGTTLHLFIVQVLSDPEIDPKSIPRCGNPPQPVAVTPSAPTPWDFLTSPVGALAAVRGERANAGAAELRRLQCGFPGEGRLAEPGLVRHFAVFSLGRDRNGVLPPLSWVLPPEVRDSIAAPGFDGFPAAGNAEALAALGEEWRDALPKP